MGSCEHMLAARLQDALCHLSTAIREVEAALNDLKAERDPLASHIFISRRHYRRVVDGKGGKRRALAARLSYDTACKLGFRGSLNEWDRLMGAADKL